MRRITVAAETEDLGEAVFVQLRKTSFISSIIVSGRTMNEPANAAVAALMPQ
jgi:hypothetical protein